MEGADFEQMVGTLMSVRPAFEKEMEKFTDLFFEKLRLARAEAPPAPGAGGAAEAPSSSLLRRRAIASTLNEDKLDFATAEDAFLHTCAHASWALHDAPRYPADRSDPSFFESSARWCFNTYAGRFLEKLEKQYKTCLLAAEGDGVLEMVVRLSAYLANVLPRPAGNEVLLPSPLLQCAPGGGPHWALAAWEDKVAEMLASSHEEGGRQVVRTHARAARAFVGRLLEAAPAGPAAPGSATAYLRSLAVLYGAREALLFPTPPLALYEPLVASALHDEQPYTPPLTCPPGGGTAWSPLLPSTLPELVAAGLLRAGRGGDAMRVLQAGAFSAHSATTAVSSCVAAALALAPRLLLASPARTGCFFEHLARLPKVYSITGSKIGENAQVLSSMWLAESSPANLGRFARESGLVGSYAAVLGAPLPASPDATRAAEDKRAEALAGGAGSEEREGLARGFLLRAARLLRDFASSVGDARAPAADGEPNPRVVRLGEATAFATHFFPALPLALADALFMVGAPEEAIDVLHSAPRVLHQVLNPPDSAGSWWAKSRSIPTSLFALPLFPLFKSPPPPGMGPLVAAQRAAALDLAEARARAGLYAFKVPGGVHRYCECALFYIRHEAFSKGLRDFTQLTLSAGEEEEEAAAVAAHGLLGAFFSFFPLSLKLISTQHVDGVAAVAADLLAASQLPHGGPLVQLLSEAGLPEGAGVEALFDCVLVHLGYD